MADESKTAAQTAAPALIPQPHGGALLSGGVPGNKGGGRIADEVRGLARGGFADNLPRAIAIASGMVDIKLRKVCEHCGLPPKSSEPEPVNVRAAIDSSLKALDLLGNYGVGKLQVRGIADEVVRDRLRLTIDTIRAELPEDQARALLEKLEPIWR